MIKLTLWHGIADAWKAAQGRPQAFIFHWQPRDKMFDNITPRQAPRPP